MTIPQDEGDQTPSEAQVLELYRLAVEMADRVSARRSAANTYFVSLQTATLAVLGLLTGRSVQPSSGVLIAVCLAGACTSVTWFLLLRSYRDLNRAKFEVITKMEEHLPVRVFGNEWVSLKQDPVKRWRPRYAELGSVERVVPWIFLAIYALLAIQVRSA